MNIHLYAGPVALILVLLFTGSLLMAGDVTLLVNYPSISPNGDGVKDYLTVIMTLAVEVDTLAVTIENPSATELYDTIFFMTDLPAGSYSATWDGTDSLGTLLAEGGYILHLHEYSGGSGEDETRTVIIDLTSPGVVLDRIEPGVYVPGYPDTSASVSVYYSVSGFNPGDIARAVVYNPYGTGQSYPLGVETDGEYVFHWKSAGVLGGIYEIELIVEDEAGNSDTDGGAVMVDIAGPVIGFITELDPHYVTVAPPSIEGYCYDISGMKSVELTWTGVDLDESDPFPPDSTWMQGDTIYWIYATPDSVNGTAAITEGPYKLKVISYDMFDHQTTGKFEFTIDRTAPPAVVIEQPQPRVIESLLTLTLVYDEEDTDSLLYYVRNEGITDSALKYVYDPKTVYLKTGLNEIWLRARDKAGNTSGNSNVVSVAYAPQTGISIPEVFRGTDRFQIVTVDRALRVKVEIYDLGGERVTRLSGWGPATKFEMEWDLLNDDGDEVRNGPYLAVITIDYDRASTVEKYFIAVVR